MNYFTKQRLILDIGAFHVLTQRDAGRQAHLQEANFPPCVDENYRLFHFDTMSISHAPLLPRPRTSTKSNITNIVRVFKFLFCPSAKGRKKEVFSCPRKFIDPLIPVQSESQYATVNAYFTARLSHIADAHRLIHPGPAWQAIARRSRKNRLMCASLHEPAPLLLER